MYVNVVVEMKDQTSYEFEEVESLGMNAMGFLSVQTKNGWMNFNLPEIVTYSFDFKEEEKEEQEPVAEETNDNVVKFTK